ncbi:MAG: hypothetical protein ABIW85_03790 [Variovorax sp.]
MVRLVGGPGRRRLTSHPCSLARSLLTMHLLTANFSEEAMAVSRRACASLIFALIRPGIETDSGTFGEQRYSINKTRFIVALTKTL